jgi:excisionase family DNA binding protein
MSTEVVIFIMREETGQNQSVLIDVRRVAEYLGVKVEWIYDGIRKKEIPHAKVGRYLRFRKYTIDDWLAQQRTALAFDNANSGLKRMDKKTRR